MNIAGDCLSLLSCVGSLNHGSELLEPQKLIPYLLQSESSILPPDIAAVYVQAAVKVFGTWVADVAQDWDDERFSEIQDIADSIMARMQELVSSPFVEVQERVRSRATATLPRALITYSGI